MALPTTHSRRDGGVWARCKRGLDRAYEWIRLGSEQVSEKLPDYLHTGSSVEVIQDGSALRAGTVRDIRIYDDMVLFQPDRTDDGKSILVKRESILVKRELVRPIPECTVYDFEGAHVSEHVPGDSFRLYSTVDVWIMEEWIVGVIIHVPTEKNSTYQVRLLRESGDLIVRVRSKMRLHKEWSSVSRTWNDTEIKVNGSPSVGLLGSKRARVLQFFQNDYMLVEYTDVKNLDGTCAKEIVNIKMWDENLWRRLWRKVACNDDLAHEFECYMPGYICLAILGVVCPVLSTDPAKNWPDSMIWVFSCLGGLAISLCILLLTGMMISRPKTNAQLLKWRLMCMFAVATCVVFMSIHVAYAREAVVRTREVKMPGWMGSQSS